MKYLNWIKVHMNLVSFIIGVGFVVAGREDVGRLLISHGGL